MRFPHFKQADQMDCGPTCLKIIASYYGKKHDLDDLRSFANSNREGTSFLGLSDAAEKIGFRTTGVRISYSQLSKEKLFPCIAHWNQSHYLVIYKIKDGKIYVSDPAHTLGVYTEEEFRAGWEDEKGEGFLLLLEPTPTFYEYSEPKKKDITKAGFHFVYKYLRGYRKHVLILVMTMVVGSLLQLLFPFLTQNIVDIGIKNADLNYIYLILVAQLMLFAGRTTADIVRNRVLITLGNRVSVSLVSDFFAKLMKLPISFFDVKMTGDIMQRINDHKRIESFLTTSSLSTLFSVLNLIIFSVILIIYNPKIFYLFLIGSVLYFLWVVFFLKKRADIDYKRFKQMSKNQSKEIEFINGMQEIKLNNAERQKLWDWEQMQINLFEITRKGLSLSQVQNSGAALINELKNILITFLSAKLVLDGSITIGMMLSISYITGQLNGPILELVNFIQRWQDAKLSFERIGEIHDKKEEEPEIQNRIIHHSDILLQNVCFKYDQYQQSNTLNNISIKIPSNKITAIVGSSGSGKTTLIKLLLKFYEPSSGNILIGDQNLSHISPSLLRSKIGVVMQEGYIFSDTIMNNIAVGDQNVNIDRLDRAANIANIMDFISTLPLGFNTQIGYEGVGLSTGQKQRILIARAVYKDPEYLFFDEATSALDSNNEKVITNRLNSFFSGRTVVIVAHRLSTVKHADHIIVLDKGNVIEIGDHQKLTASRGTYYELVKNQLELGN